jgi:hypothetical protein
MTTGADWDRVKQLFHEALDTSPDARLAFVPGGNPPPLLHQFLGRLDVLDIDDVVTALHRIRSMAGDSHPHDLGNSGTTHIPDSRPSEIVEL